MIAFSNTLIITYDVKLLLRTVRTSVRLYERRKKFQLLIFVFVLAAYLLTYD